MAGDFGADLILHGPEGRITVQAKRYSGNVGNKAVQEAYSGMAHYGADKGWVVTNSRFTRQPVHRQSPVELHL